MKLKFILWNSIYKVESFQPGATFKESECEVCQCIDSSYICDASFCEKKTLNLTHIEDFDVEPTKCESLI